MMMPSIFGDRFFDDWRDFGFPSMHKALYGNEAKSWMKTDIKETESCYEVAVDLPGYAKEDVKVKLDNGYLIVTAAKNVDNDKKDENGKYILRERYSGSMSRSFYVGDNLTEQDIHAKFENGILTLDVPKELKQIPQGERLIQIEG